MGTDLSKSESVKAWLRRHSLLIGLIAALVILWVTEQPFFLCHPDWQLFLKEVAFAGLIACIFGFTIERIQRREFVKLVEEERKTLKQDVFLYAYGHNIPDETKEEIRRSILEEPFFRRDFTATWRFSALPGQPDYLHVAQEYKYVLVNKTPNNLFRDFRFTQTGAEYKGAVTYSKFVLVKVQRHDKTIEQWEAKDMTLKEDADKPHMMQLSTRFPVAGNEEVRVYYQIEQVRRIVGDDLVTPSQPVVGTITVSLEAPLELDLEFTVACKSRQLTTALESQPPLRYCYNFTGGMLPYQGIGISWSPRVQKAAAPTVNPQV